MIRRISLPSLLLLGIVSLSLLVPGSCAMSHTPRHALSELRDALLHHDSDRALRYVDVDSIVDHLVNDLIQKYETKADTPLETAGVRAGRAAADFLMPGIKAVTRSQVRAAIASDDQWGYFEDIRRSSVWYLRITAEGDRALVEPRGKSDIKFRMARVRDGDYWRIVELVRK